MKKVYGNPEEQINDMIARAQRSIRRDKLDWLGAPLTWLPLALKADLHALIAAGKLEIASIEKTNHAGKKVTNMYIRKTV